MVAIVINDVVELTRFSDRKMNEVLFVPQKGGRINGMFVTFVRVDFIAWGQAIFPFWTLQVQALSLITWNWRDEKIGEEN